MKEKTLLEKLKQLKQLLEIKKSANTESLRQFIRDFYGEEMAPEFYELLLPKLGSKKLLKIAITNDIYKLIGYLKNNCEPAEKIKKIILPQDYFRISKKHINKIISLLQTMPTNENELSKVISEELEWKLRKRPIDEDLEYECLAYKLYQTFGLDNSIELINQKFGSINYEQIYYLMNDIKIQEITAQERQILINYLFRDKNENNTPIRRMLNGDFKELFIHFSYLHNELPYFINKLGTKLKSNKLQLLLKEKYLTTDPTIPEITGEIQEDMLSSYYHKYSTQPTTEEKVLCINKELYNSKLKNKYKSSIPQIEIKKDPIIRAELLSLSDPRNLIHGYRSGNCFRLNGDAAILFSQFIDSEHMRILSFSTDEYKDYAMVLLMRNGNVLIAQGIETSKWVPNEITGKRLYDLTREALRQIMEYMNDHDDEIVATIIGATNQNVIPYNNQYLPFLVQPIIENNGNYYNGVSTYQCLLDLEKFKKVNDMKVYIPDKRYYDKRAEILTRENNSWNQLVEKRIIALRYQRSQTQEGYSFYKKISNHNEKETICNKDWYITLFTDGMVDSFLSDTNDPRAKEEYQDNLEKIYQKKKDMI